MESLNAKFKIVYDNQLIANEAANFKSALRADTTRLSVMSAP